MLVKIAMITESGKLVIHLNLLGNGLVLLMQSILTVLVVSVTMVVSVGTVLIMCL